MKLPWLFTFISARKSLCIFLILLPIAGLAKPVTIAVISDLNGSYGSTDYPELVNNVVGRIIELKPDLVISAGDMVAGQQKPLLPRGHVEDMWKSFHKVVSDPLATAGIPLAVTPGNHDGAAYPHFHLERAIFAEQWQPRKPAVEFIDGSHYPFYYAFAVGNVVLVSVDATMVGPLSGEQMNWLETLLANSKVSSSKTILFSHVPLWPFATGRERDYIGDARLEKLLQNAGVDLYLSGHHHAFYPGHKDGIYYISQACLGAGPRPLIGNSVISNKGFSVIQIDGDDIRVNAYEGSNLAKPVSWDSLPLTVNSKVAELRRADQLDPHIDDTILFH